MGRGNAILGADSSSLCFPVVILLVLRPSRLPSHLKSVRFSPHPGSHLGKVPPSPWGAEVGTLARIFSQITFWTLAWLPYSVLCPSLPCFYQDLRGVSMLIHKTSWVRGYMYTCISYGTSQFLPLNRRVNGIPPSPENRIPGFSLTMQALFSLQPVLALWLGLNEGRQETYDASFYLGPPESLWLPMLPFLISRGKTTGGWEIRGKGPLSESR